MPENKITAEARESWPGRIHQVRIGATREDGGTRDRVLAVGGEETLPFCHFEGRIPHRPLVALEVWMEKPNLPRVLEDAYGELVNRPGEMARRCVGEFGADLVCLNLEATHPDRGNRSPEDACAVVREVLDAISAPLIIVGPEHHERCNAVMLKVSQEAAGERCLIGTAEQENYKTLVAACLADGHALVNMSPIDVNLAKQLNILTHDMGLPYDRMVMDPLTGALGYGLEYTFSVMERIRLGGLGGDEALASPMINMVGLETWKVKEAKAPQERFPEWGDESLRGPAWEIACGTALLLAGSDILVLNHPRAAAQLRGAIDDLMEDGDTGS